METRKIDQFVVEKKIKSFHKYCPTAIATTFNSQFVVDAEMQTKYLLEYIKFRSLLQLCCPKYQLQELLGLSKY